MKIKTLILIELVLSLLCGCTSESGFLSLLTSTEECQNYDEVYDTIDTIYYCDVDVLSFEESVSCLNDIDYYYSQLSVACKAEVEHDVTVSARLLVTRFAQQASSEEYKNLGFTDNENYSNILTTWKNLFELVAIWDTKFGLRSRVEENNEAGYQESYNEIYLSIREAVEANKLIIFDPEDLNGYLRTYAFVIEAAGDAFSYAEFESKLIFVDIITMILEFLDVRIGMDTYVQDLSCWLATCQNASELDSIVELMANLDNPIAFNNLLSERELDYSLRKLFTSIGNYQGYLIDILRFDPSPSSSGNIEDLPGLGENYSNTLTNYPFDVPKFLSKLAVIINSYKKYASHKESYDFYNFSGLNELRNGLDAQTRSVIFGRFDIKIQNLKQETETLRNQYESNLQDLRVKIQNEIENNQIETSIDLLTLDYIDSQRKLIKIRENARVERDRFEEIIKNIRISLAENGYFKRKIEGGGDAFIISNSDATYNLLLENFIDLPVKAISLDKGDILELAIMGDYSPTCAISKSKISEELSLDNFTIDARGFVITTTSNSSQVSTIDKYTNYADYMDTNTSVSAGIPSEYISVRNNVVTGSRFEEGTRFSEVDQTSIIHSISLNNGVRLTDTPFPNQPAGAILAVSFPSRIINKSRSAIKDIRYVGLGGTIIAEEDTDVWIVVNDCDEQNSNSGNSLSARYQIYNEPSATANQLLEALLEGLNILNNDRETLLQMGEAALIEINKRKKEIMQMAVLESDDIKAARNLVDLFTIVIEHESASLEKELIANDLILKIKKAGVQIEGYKNNLDLSNQLQVLAQNIYAKSRLNFDVAYTGYVAKSAIDFFMNSVRPFVDLYFPSIKSTVADQIYLDNIENIRNIHLPLTVRLESIEYVLSILKEALLDEDLEMSVDLETMEIMVTIPKQDIINVNLPTINDFRKTNLFEAISNVKDNLVLPIALNDLYNKPSKRFGMSNKQVRPIIRKTILGIGFTQGPYITEDFLREDAGWRVTMTMGDFIRVPTSNGAYFFDFNKDEHSSVLSKTIPLAFVYKNDLASLRDKLQFSSSRAGFGFSPFSDIAFSETAGFFNYLNSIHPDIGLPIIDFVEDIYLMFEIEFQTGPDITWMN